MPADELDGRRRLIVVPGGGPGAAAMDGAGRSDVPRRGPRVLIFSDQPLIADGVAQLLPDGWREQAAGTHDPDAVHRHSGGSLSAIIVDAGTAGAREAAATARPLGASVILLVTSLPAQLDPELLALSDAILLRDEVERRTLRLALAAGRAGMRLLPRALTPLPVAPPSKPPASPRGEPAQRALELLAGGLRDAEIARELNLSESAVRKLIQRAVRLAGARTRCQAVAAAIRGGELR